MERFTTKLQPGTSVIYIPEGAHSSEGIKPEEYVHGYEYWHLVLQPEDKRAVRGMAAGLLIARRAVILVSDLTSDEWADKNGFADAPKRLAETVGAEFTGHYTAPAFNNGDLAGQTQAQVHAHIYPVVTEQLPAPGTRNGMGAFIEAHRQINGLV